ncbi:MAG: hypothetical protein IKR85_04365 [Clostridia bacterium]|nr:hypothetical protein [Clostridia bacterium]
MNTDLLLSACELLRDVTPLKSDCGQLCGAACCRDNGEAGSGVWLLPGESSEKMKWGEIIPCVMPETKTTARMLVCRGKCVREARPFMCRIFPLSPFYSKKNAKWSVRMDRRAAALCPLFAYGKKGLSPEFVQKAKQAVSLLASDDGYRTLLETLEREEAAFRIEL